MSVKQIHDIGLSVTVEGQGRPFIWGHGLMSSRAFDDDLGLFNWHGLEDLIKIVRYDARGHGNSDASHNPEDYTWSNLAADMIGVADAVGVDTFIAGGASMGCGTSVQAALACPERISALVLVCPPTAWETREAQKGVLEQLSTVVESQGLTAILPILKENPLLPKWLLEEKPEIEEAFLSQVGNQNEGVIPHLLRGSGHSNFPDREKLKALEIPALILGWVDDPAHPLTTSEELSVLLPSSRIHIAEDLKQISNWPHILRDFVENIS